MTTRILLVLCAMVLVNAVSLAANVPNPPACPPGTRQPTGAPVFNGPLPQLPVDGSEYEAIQDAIAFIDSLTEAQLPGNGQLAGCLRVALKQCQICVSGSNAYDGTVPNFMRAGNRAGWYGDQIAVAERVVIGGATPGAGGGSTAGDCYLAAVLAHEAVHMGQSNEDAMGNPIPMTHARAKELEEPAIEAELAVMSAWGMGNSALYRFKEAWLQELCDLAMTDPNGTASLFQCPLAWATNQAGGFNTPPTPTHFGAVYGVENTIFVSTKVLDGSDRDEHTDIKHVTDLVVYADRPFADWYTLLVIGHNASQMNTQYQWLTFDDDYVLQSSSSRTTIPHCTIRSHAKAPDDVTTYFWDDAREEILVAEDTDADGLPDLWTVFADASLHPEIADTVSLEAVDVGVLRTSNSGIYFGGVYGPDSSVVDVIDGNADGVADSVAAHLVKDVYEAGPLLQEHPAPGKTSLEVFGTPTHQIQLWRSNADGDHVVLLGTATVAYASCLATISCPALEEGTYVALFDVASETGNGPFLIEEEEL